MAEKPRPVYNSELQAIVADRSGLANVDLLDVQDFHEEL